MSDVAYDTGDVLRVTGTFRNAAGAVMDPTAVLGRSLNPLGVVTSLTMVRASTGVYYTDLHFSLAGRWTVRFYSTGSGETSEEREYYVRRSAF